MIEKITSKVVFKLSFLFEFVSMCIFEKTLKIIGIVSLPFCKDLLEPSRFKVTRLKRAGKSLYESKYSRMDQEKFVEGSL